VLCHHLFGSLQLAGPLAHTHAAKQGDIELGVNATVVVTAGWGNTPTPFKVPDIFRCHREETCQLTNMYCFIHTPYFTSADSPLELSVISDF